MITKHFLSYSSIFLTLVCGLILTLSSCSTRSSGESFPHNNVTLVYVDMPAQEVLNIMGKPYTREPYIGGEKWIWSYSSKEFDHTFVVTIEDGIVRSLSEYKDSAH